MLPTKFQANWPVDSEEAIGRSFGGDVFKEFQDGPHGGHLGYQKGTILAILNLYNAPIPSSFGSI